MLYVPEGSISRCGAGRYSYHHRTRPIGPGGQVETSLPVQVAGNTQAPAMAVAWIAADLISEDS